MARSEPNVTVEGLRRIAERLRRDPGRRDSAALENNVRLASAMLEVLDGAGEIVRHLAERGASRVRQATGRLM